MERAQKRTNSHTRTHARTSNASLGRSTLAAVWNTHSEITHGSLVSLPSTDTGPRDPQRPQRTNLTGQWRRHHPVVTTERSRKSARARNRRMGLPLIYTHIQLCAAVNRFETRNTYIYAELNSRAERSVCVLLVHAGRYDLAPRCHQVVKLLSRFFARPTKCSAIDANWRR